MDFVNGIDSRRPELACVRISTELRARFPDLDEIFLEPVPRGDPDLRAKVQARYGSLTRTEN